MREAEEVECLRAALPTAGTTINCVASELQYSGLRFVENKTELAQTFTQAIEKRPSILGVFEANDAVISISDDDYIPLG